VLTCRASLYYSAVVVPDAVDNSSESICSQLFLGLIELPMHPELCRPKSGVVLVKLLLLQSPRNVAI